ncbi:MAG: hypothetical protein K2H38_13555 [Muribaculaceae bacterium]|nr:hypothetical protein [Muribaculaceae bacterium]
MTQQEKDILMEKMLDPDGVLSDKDLEMVFHDDELKEIYELSSAVRGACVQLPKIDVEREWRLFRHRIRPRPSRWKWVMRVAAIFLGVMFVSGIVRIALDHILTEKKTVAVVKSKPLTTEKFTQEGSNPEPLPIVENDDLPASDTPVSRKAVTPRKNAIENTVDEADIDVDEYLRLQQARIDNDIAMIQAELLIDEIKTLRETELQADGEVPLEQNEERYVIMQ